MIVEMRTYKTKPGSRSRFLEIFRTKSIPARTEIGDENTRPVSFRRRSRHLLFYARLSDMPSREPMKAQFYEGKLWKAELENVLMPMLEKYDVVVVDDPDDLIRWPFANIPMAQNPDEEEDE